MRSSMRPDPIHATWSVTVRPWAPNAAPSRRSSHARGRWFEPSRAHQALACEVVESAGGQPGGRTPIGERRSARPRPAFRFGAQTGTDRVEGDVFHDVGELRIGPDPARPVATLEQMAESTVPLVEA